MSTPETVKAQLQADIAAANAATGKADTTLHAAVSSLIEGFGGGGEEVFFTTGGQMYVKNVVLPETVTTLPSNCYANMPEMKSIYATGVTKLGGHYAFGNSVTPIEVLIAPKLTNWGTNTYWQIAGQLKEVQAGSIGFPVTVMKSSYGFRNSDRNDLVITIYVDATTLAEVPTDITNYAPFEAKNATVIYRNSTTGEVITE